MERKTIMLVCTAGMSTSMLVQKMREASEKSGLDVEIFAVPMANADKFLESKEIDVVLLGPQIKYAKSQFDEKTTGTNTKVAVIGMQEYGMMRGDRVLEQALKL